MVTSSQQLEADGDQDVTCAICHDKLLDPVTTPCGHNYCKLCLDRWLRRCHKCPLDNAMLPKVEFKVNRMLQALVWANNTPAELQARPPVCCCCRVQRGISNRVPCCGNTSKLISCPAPVLWRTGPEQLVTVDGVFWRGFPNIVVQGHTPVGSPTFHAHTVAHSG